MTTVIPYYNRFDLVHKLLRDLYGVLPDNDEIVLVDDASDDQSAAKTVAWWQNGVLNKRLRYFRNETNLGFGGSMNKGAKIAINNGADIVVLLSDDVLVYQSYTQRLEEIVTRHKDTLIGGEMLCHDTGWNVLPECGVIPYLNGWFLACHKDIWAELGGFDPKYGRFDYEDVDLSTKAWWLGVKLEIVDTKMRHIGGQTIGTLQTDRMGKTIINGAYWRAKWLPHAHKLKEQIYGIKTEHN